MMLPINQLRDLSALFSRSEVRRWLKNDFKSIDVKLNRYHLLEKNKGSTYLSVLKKTYKILERQYPNEYILKNEFLNQWLKKELGTTDSVLYSEFRIGKAIADLAMFNGVSKVFEIKTILDKEYRLSNQLQEYKKLFNEIYIIVPLEHLSKYIDYDFSVGLITYDTQSRTFNRVRCSERNVQIDLDVIMQVLHTKEYLSITKEYYNELPPMNAFNQFEICKELIANIPIDVLNKMFLKVVKDRGIHNLFFNKINSEFNQISLALNLKQKEKDQLIINLKSNTL
ncbi:sce7726 family protein [Flavobacterium sp. SM2513]|uniref:sce7726 family protein n=1 Tax=Flavobacterium sp. SM2513 TaxID=3424766 RepID=UPI003D7FE021